MDELQQKGGIISEDQIKADDAVQDMQNEKEDISSEQQRRLKDFVPRIELRMKLEAKELWAFSMIHAYRGIQGLFNLLFTVAFAYLLLRGWNTIDFARKAMFLVCILMFSVIQPALLYLKSVKQARDKHFDREIVLGFSDMGLRIRQGDALGVFLWEEIYKCAYYPQLILIYVDVRRAYLIPKRYFSDCRAELVEILKAHTRG